MTARGDHRAGLSRNHADTEAAAERAQAKRFAKILRRELTEMNEKLGVMSQAIQKIPGLKKD